MKYTQLGSAFVLIATLALLGASCASDVETTNTATAETNVNTLVNVNYRSTGDFSTTPELN